MQIFADKMETTLKSSTLVVYPVHDLLLNFLIGFRRWPILNGLNLIGILIVTYSCNGKGEECKKDDNQLSVYGFSSFTLTCLSNSFRLKAACTACKKM